MSWMDGWKSCEPTVGMSGGLVILELPDMAKLRLSPDQARELARQLVALADLIEPPRTDEEPAA